MKKLNFILCAAVLAVSVFYVSVRKKTVSVDRETTRKYVFENEKLRLTPVGFEELSEFQDDTLSEALPALKNSCVFLTRRSNKWNKICSGLNTKVFRSDAEIRSFITENMIPYKVNDGEQGVFTGYYIPEIDGALRKTNKYTTPVYGLPKDIVKVDFGKFNPDLRGNVVFGRESKNEIVPYLTRKQIDEGKMRKKAKIIAYLENPVELFMLQIQGSGVIRLKNGKRVTLGYAGNNGRSFTGIGSVMNRLGLLKESGASAGEIKQWLLNNPKKARELMHENERYIFFKILPQADALGTLGMPLTPKRSLAVDPAYVPLGSFLWLETKDPNGVPLNRLVTAQDTGAAIKGAVRGDFFFGTGRDVLKEAGRMKSKGTYYILLPKDAEGAIDTP